jgi:hypothetical protein
MKYSYAEYIIYLAFVSSLFILAGVGSITKKEKVFNFFISLILSILLLGLSLYCLKEYSYKYDVPRKLIFFGTELTFCLIGWFFFFESAEENKKRNRAFILPLKNGSKMKFHNPFVNFLVYAGSGSGKTKSVGKPLLGEYIRNGFAGIIYDLKDRDYTKTAYHFIQKYKSVYNCRFYYIDFVNPHYRTNPIKPSVLKDPNLLAQLMYDFFSATSMDDKKKDEWFEGAVGILKGVANRFFVEYPDLCTIPHILYFILMAEDAQLTSFLKGNTESVALAAGFLNAAGSERTQASIKFTLTNTLGNYILNKKILYVLSGDDFDFNLIDPNQPKMVAICSSYPIESLLAPVVSVMVKVTSRFFSMQNKIPFVYFLDEATTFKIQDLDGMLSVLREYLASFVILTQSPSRIEKVYGKLPKASIEANCGNWIIGRTKEGESLKNIIELFYQKKEIRKSQTSGSNNSSSTTRSENKEKKYEPAYIAGLNPGQFVGNALEASYSEFDVRFKLYDEVETPLPVFEEVTEAMLNENFEGIKTAIEKRIIQPMLMLEDM